MADSNSDHIWWEWPNMLTVALTSSSFVAGMLMGRRLPSTFKRISSLVTVGPTKLALVVRKDLKMSKGKIAGQCCHGTLLAYKNLQRTQPELLQAWEDCGQPKVVLGATNLDHINQLIQEAEKRRLPMVTVNDAGRTQVTPGSLTLLAVGPAMVTDVDSVTGSLHLL
ncbi:hypothetical protein Pcinc_004715 [Petrolisthes cinctipes]|uniref:peptidyl-tRNA hydrolase n=1 Tax=Petrolisthes cinctipes TaxID=88211 RepID=A0AAE1GGD5_PETCI|nr:hypothetical protein Pcinc_004715 [Petrolisthes cinctipes]